MTIPTRRRLLVLDTRDDDPDATVLKAMIATVLSAADEGRLAPTGHCDMVVQPSRDDRRGDAVRFVRTTGQRPRIHIDHDGPFTLKHAGMPAAIVDALRRPVASASVTEAELDVLGTIVAIADAGGRHLVACSATPWQEPLVTGGVPTTMSVLMSSTVAIPSGQPELVLVDDEKTGPVDPDHSPWMADVVHASLSGGELTLSPLRVEGPRDGLMFPKNRVACHRTAPLPGTMETLRILSGMRRAADPSADA